MGKCRGELFKIGGGVQGRRYTGLSLAYGNSCRTYIETIIRNLDVLKRAMPVTFNAHSVDTEPVSILGISTMVWVSICPI